MKYRDLDGQFKEIHVKVGDTLPVGSVVDYEGEGVPAGWTEVDDKGSLIVSSEEPTTGEEVWFQVSGNIFDKNNANLLDNTYVDIQQNAIAADITNLKMFYVPIIGGKKYVVKKVKTTRFRIGTTETIPKHGTSLINKSYNDEGTQIIINTSSNANYLSVYYFRGESDTLTEEEILNSVIIEEYPKKIHTKNDKGEYEEFYNEEEKEVYSADEQRIGTYLGKPLYRQVFRDLQCPNNGIGTFTNMKRDTDKIVRLEGIFTDKSSENEHWFVIFGKTEVSGMGLNFNQYSGTLYLVSTKDMSKYTCDVIMEYTKTTD